LFNGTSTFKAGRVNNPKVVGSNPTPATKEKEASQIGLAFSFTPRSLIINNINIAMAIWDFHFIRGLT
jgi:hypothetical protein